MNWAALFGAVNAAALLAWAALILLPGRSRPLPLLRYGAVGLLCLFYVALVVTALTVGFGEGRGGRVDFTTIAGVRAIFASDGGMVAGWTHYLALDLFAGVWIAEDSDRRGIRRIAQAPVLLLTFVAGPAGLLLHYAIRLLRTGRERVHPPL